MPVKRTPAILAAGFEVAGVSNHAGIYYTRTLRDGTYAAAGNLSGPWGWDTYTNEATFTDGSPWIGQSEDYDTPEAMLAAMRALGLI
jgi:hypothetical protein